MSGAYVSTESPRSDRSRWVVPIVVATIAAAATILAAILPVVVNRDEVNPVSGNRTDGGQPVPTAASRSSASVPGAGAASAGSGGTVRHRGSGILFTLTGADTDDLDSGGEDAADDIPDVQLTSSAITATANSRIALLPGAEYSPASCREVLGGGSATSVDGDDIQEGSVLCVRTSMDLMGVMLIQAVKRRDGKLAQVNYNYIIWTETP